MVALLLTTALFALIGNTLTIMVMSRVRRMHAVLNYLIFNLTVADLLASLFCLTVDVTIEMKGRWIFGAAMCNVLLPLRALSVLASIFTLTMLSLTRCWAVVYPFRTQPSACFAKISIASIWTGSCVLIVPYISVLGYDDDIKMCTEDWSRAHSQLYTVLTSMFTYVLPVFTIASSYTRIVYETSDMSRTRRFSTALMTTNKLAIAEQRSILKLSVVISASFALCSLPYHVVWVLYEFTDVHKHFVYFVDLATLTYVLFYLNSALNPINYNIFSETFRRGSFELFREILTRRYR